MTTESLCTINSHNNNNNNSTSKQRQDQNHQQHQKEQKQTIRRITKGSKTSSQKVASLTTEAASLSKNEAQISTKTTNNIKRETSSFNKDPDLEDKVNFVERHTFIDSRSILTNKEKLKRFWEHKMEMDIKLRQKELNSSKQKGVSNLVDKNNNNEDNSTKSQIQEENVIDKQTNDENWRSLSPNEEPTKNDINNRLNIKQQVSAKLICEKLRDYQATDGAILAERQEEKSERSVTTQDAIHLEDEQQNGFDSSNNKDKLDDDDLIKCQVPKNNNGHNDEIQLMSIDPTLCHSSENINSNNNLPASYIQQTSSNLANENVLISNFNDKEEQTVNEEFSSSNSSFGPMSMSMAGVRQLDNNDVCSLSDSQDLVSNNQDQVSDTEDEPNSTQSGSVLTVINTKLDQNNKSNSKKNISSLNDNQKSLSWNGSSMDQPDTLTSETNEQELEEKSNIQGEDKDRAQDRKGSVSEDGQEDNDDENEDEGGSNIGVAFESLHFDNDIKSSKQEKVDDELLIAPTPVKRPTNSRFNASEVRSVCNFISAAITDATRQVENYMNLGPNKKSQTGPEELCKDIVSDNGDESHENKQDSSSSIQRATFIRESPEFTTSEDLELVDIANESHVTPGNEQQVEFNKRALELAEDHSQDIETYDEIPSADLSSIFEANVRREIERFETNSTVKKSSGCKYANKNTLTEWRIAEEIRLFNAREMELKKRFEDTSRAYGNGNRVEAGGRDTNNSISSQQMTNSMDLKSRQNQQHEAVVRFGKTLQIPKASTNSDSAPASSSSSSCTSMNNLAKSIKLSTTATTNVNGGGGQQTTMISMHKFIASGGKRFVFTNTNTSSSNQNNSNNTTPLATTAATLQNNLFTKSMSNLSTSNNNINKNDLQNSRVVDYKAVDSLKCKETPNVKPGIARKVIETFSRMQSSQDSLLNRANESQSNVTPITTTTATTRQYLHPQHQMSSSSCLSNSAEWKIQEELREMRAREAELRDQRSHMVNSSLQISHNTNQDDLNASYNGTDSSSEHHLNIDSVTISELKQTTSDEYNHQLHKEPLSFSSECLYPIKQTIDSFRKLNSSSQQQQQATNNNFSISTSHQNDNYSAKIQKKSTQTRIDCQQNNVTPPRSSDDYDSKVGGQRRKISMIEKWENKMY